MAELHQIFVHVAHGSVFHWWHCDMLCTSSFVDDVTFSHNGPTVHYVYFYAATKDDKRNSWDSNQILLNNKDDQVLIASWIQREKSAIYDCLAYQMHRPIISPAPIDIPQRPVRRLADGSSSTCPTDVMKTALKKDNSKPSTHGNNKQNWQFWLLNDSIND